MGDSDEAPPRQFDATAPSPNLSGQYSQPAGTNGPVYRLKPKEFERVNEPPPAASADPALDERARQGDPNDVFALRQQLRAREQNRGMDAVKPVAPRKSRRKRDYWLLMIAGNGLFVALPTLVFRGNGVVALYSGAGIIMLSLGATWVMWFIMDDY